MGRGGDRERQRQSKRAGETRAADRLKKKREVTKADRMETLERTSGQETADLEKH